MFCPKCGEQIEKGSSFCQNCGTAIEKRIAVEMPKKGFIKRIEQTFYFRIATFAWIVLFIAVSILTIYVVNLAERMNAIEKFFQIQAPKEDSRLFPPLGKAKQDVAKAQIELLGQALDRFRLDTGRYPSTQEGLNALMENPGINNWNGPYAKRKQIIGPWGNPYVYISPGLNGDYDLMSYGADGKKGGEGLNADIKSWDMK